MKLRAQLAVASSQEWLDMVLSNFDSFLQDHANCERKASSMVLSFVAKYPDRLEMIPTLIEVSIEELQHFQQVYQLMQERGVTLATSMEKDHYATRLLKLCRTGREEHFLDRLVVAGVIETRGAERFRLIADHLTDRELGQFYKQFWRYVTPCGRHWLRWVGT